jgi:two-component system, NarL family, response regulator NreC
MRKIRILVADDHGVVRKGLCLQLQQHEDFEIVGQAADGRQAVEMAEQLQPNVVIMDISMPTLNGIEATAQIIRRNSRVGVVILSMHSDDSYLARVLAAGARGYLLKDSADDELPRAVRAVAGGTAFFSPAIGKLLLEDYMRQLQERGLQDSYELLTERERETLQLLAEGKTNKEVAVILNVGVSTIETHRYNIMTKLDLHSAADIVRYAVRKKIIV